MELKKEGALMGRKNKSYSKDLHQQAYDRLTGMQAFGESKREAVANGTDRDKIFSVNTYKTYWKHTKYFIAYIKEHNPECTTLKKAKKYVNEWLQHRVDPAKELQNTPVFAEGSASDQELTGRCPGWKAVDPAVHPGRP